MNNPTAEILAMQETVAHFAREHSLEIFEVAYSRRVPGATRGDGFPMLPKVVISPGGWPRPERYGRFLRWVETLPITRIRVQRRESDTSVNAWVDHEGITWQIVSTLSRPHSGAHLPGIQPPWTRDRRGRLGHVGSITPAELRTVIEHLHDDSAAGGAR